MEAVKLTIGKGELGSNLSVRRANGRTNRSLDYRHLLVAPCTSALAHPSNKPAEVSRLLLHRSHQIEAECPQGSKADISRMYVLAT
jgi:hypothetical protein